jgi:hypothetical protein
MRATRGIVFAFALVSGLSGSPPALAQEKSVSVVIVVERTTGAAGADFSPERAARLANVAPPFTEVFEDPRFPGMRFPTTGPIEGVRTMPLQRVSGSE